MAQKLTKYACEKCGREFDHITLCEKHEESHKNPTGIKYIYKPESGIPDRIILYFEGNHSHTYQKDED